LDQRFIDLLRSNLPLAGEQPLTEDTRLFELGLDSMQAVEIFFGIEDVYGIALPDEELNETVFATAGSLWQAVRSAMEMDRRPAGIDD
jgi:acyl carrier protein